MCLRHAIDIDGGFLLEGETIEQATVDRVMDDVGWRVETTSHLAAHVARTETQLIDLYRGCIFDSDRPYELGSAVELRRFWRHEISSLALPGMEAKCWEDWFNAAY